MAASSSQKGIKTPTSTITDTKNKGFKTMGLVERVVALFIVMAILQVSDAAVYKVGDSAGWTTLGKIDYKKWAATKNFQIGDTISKFLPFKSNCMLCLFFCVGFSSLLADGDQIILLTLLHSVLIMIRMQTILKLGDTLSFLLQTQFEL